MFLCRPGLLYSVHWLFSKPLILCTGPQEVFIPSAQRREIETKLHHFRSLLADLEPDAGVSVQTTPSAEREEVMARSASLGLSTLLSHAQVVHALKRVFDSSHRSALKTLRYELDRLSIIRITSALHVVR